MTQAQKWANEAMHLKNENVDLRLLNEKLLSALEWAIPILEMLFAYKPIADAIVALDMTAELNLSEARAAIQAAKDA